MVQKMAKFPHPRLLTMEPGWRIYGPRNGYNFPYPRLLRVKGLNTIPTRKTCAVKYYEIYSVKN